MAGYIGTKAVALSTTTGTILGDMDVGGVTNLDVVDIDGAVNISAATTIATNNKIQFRDAAIYLNSSADGQLDIVADTEIQIAATTVDLNGALDVSGAITGTTASFTRLDINATNTQLKGDLFANTDGAFDIGASGANRPRNLYLSNSISAADITTTGTATATGVIVGNSNIGSNSSHLANLTINNNGYVGSANNSTALRIMTSGDVSISENLGIGCTPLSNLHVSSAGDTAITLQTTNAVDDNEIWQIQAAGNAANHADLIFRTRTNAGSGGSERFRIRNNGALSLGLGDVVDAIDMNVSYTADTGRTASINWRDSTDVTGSIDTRYNGASVDMFFGSLYNGGYNTSDRMVIKGNGNVCFGKTNDSVGSLGTIIYPGNGGITSTISSGNTYHVFNSSLYRFYVNDNGGIYNYQSNNSNLSDQREKKNIEALGTKWNAVKAGSVKEFHYKAVEDSDAKKVGVIAQDVESNHPELVAEFQRTEDTTRKAVKEQQMMWMAIKALQEAQTRIETLEARVTALEDV